nr:serine protease [uncultured Brevundimonas sp.]
MFADQISARAPVEAAFAVARSAKTRCDAAAVIDATVQIDQPSGQGLRTVATAFLVNAPHPDGAPRTVLVTARHVLEQMPERSARLGWRIERSDGGWRFTPQPLEIRDATLTPLWSALPDRDIAVMEVAAPEAFARAAIPLAWLADADNFDTMDAAAGDELFALGFPGGLSANRAGFPILRVGRIASWPLKPIRAFPTFLLDFRVFPGDSGGPVFRLSNAAAQPPVIVGMVIKEVVTPSQTHSQTQGQEESIGLGVIVHAAYVREAIALLDAPGRP